VLRTVVIGTRRDIGLGSVELVSLAEARDEARRLRKIARDHRDPLPIFDTFKSQLLVAQRLTGSDFV
jgi:hypothetical protein